MSQIRVELQLEDGSFTSGVLRAGQSLAEFQRELRRTNPHFDKLAASGQTGFLQFKKAEGQARTFGQTLRDVSIVMGGVTLAFSALSGASSSTIGNIVRINAEMEKLRYQLAGMSNAADPMREAAEQVRNLQNFAASTPFSLGALSNSFVKLKAAGIDPANGSLRALTDGLAAFGASDEQLNRVTVALTQMQGKGVVSMEELRQQLGESMPTAMKLMARSMGVTVGELTKMISTGTVDSKAALDKWFKEVELSYGGTGQKMQETFSGQLAKIRTEFQKLVTSGETGKAFDDLKQKMGNFANWLGSSEATRFFDVFGQGLQVLTVGVQGFVNALYTIRDVITSLGPVVPLALGGAATMMAFGRISRAIMAMRVSYESLNTSVVRTGLALRNIHAGAAIGATSAAGTVKTAADAAAAASLAAEARGANAARAALAGSVAAGGNRIFGPMLAAGGRLLGLLGPIAMGIGILGPIAWEVGKGIYSWAKGAKDAKDEIADTAVTLNNTLTDERERQAAELASLDKQIADLTRQHEAYKARFNGNESKSMLSNLERLQQKRSEMIKRHEESITTLMGDQAKKREEIYETEVAKQLQPISREYDRKMSELSEKYEKDVGSGETGKSTRQLRSDYQADVIKLRIDRIKQELELRDEIIVKMREEAKAGRESYSTVNLALDRRAQLQDQLDSLTPETLTIETLVAPEDDTKKSERLGRFFNSARDKVEELKAELNGASGAVAKLAYQMRRGDFGNLDNATDEIKKMMDLLMETTIQAETLDEALKALNNAEDSIDSVIDKMRKETVKNLAIADGVNVDDDFAFLQYQYERGIGVFENIGRTGQATFDAFANKVTQGVNLAITSTEQLATQIKENAFGTSAVDRINQVNEALKGVLGTTDSIKTSLGTLDFGRMGATVPNLVPDVDGGILDLIASVESRGDYNSTLDNGRWTGGPQNLTDMSLRNVYALQQRMLANPQNRALYGNGKGSSALGRYQIVSTTLKGLVKEMGLDWDAKFDEKTQDAMARQLLSRRGRNASGLRLEWQGLNNVSDEQIYSAWDKSVSGPRLLAADTKSVNQQTTQQTTPAVVAEPDVIAGLDQRLDSIENKMTEVGPDAQQKAREAQRLANIAQFNKDLDRAEAAQRNSDGDLEKFGTKGQEARRRGEAGDFGDNPEELAEIYKRADAIDAQTAAIKDRGKAERDAAENSKKLNEDLVKLEERRQAALAKAKNPYADTKSEDLIKLASAEAEQLALIEKINGGKDNDAYRGAQARFAKQRGAITSAEAAEAFEQLTRAAEESAKEAIVNERQLRKQEFEERIRELDALRDKAIQDGAIAADAQKQYDKAVAAERAKYNQDTRTELGKNLEQMGKFGESINKSFANIGQSLSDNIYQVISGQTNSFRAFGDMIRENIAKAMTDKAASLILSPFEKMIGGDGEKGSGIGGLIEKSLDKLLNFDGIEKMLTGAFSNISKSLSGMFSKGKTGKTGKTGFFPVKHTGGIVGRGGGWGRSAPVSAFIGAPKFHTGGIIGKPNIRAGLTPSEVPIIAKKGEGVFTPEQMKHLGGSVSSQTISINSPITVNGSAGTHEQNADLARQVARETEASMRGLIQQELVKQMRPGGLMR